MKTPPEESILEAPSHTGQSIPRVEDGALLQGRARFMDDMPVRPGTLHAAILRSPHPHARLVSVDVSEAQRMPGVFAAISREDVTRLTRPFMIGIDTPLEYYSLAVDRVRYVGEPVAVVLASDRYLAEDALDAIRVEYDPLPAVVDPIEATRDDAIILHENVGSNVVVRRHYTFGDVDQAFKRAPLEEELTIRYPRNSIPPMETYGVIAEWQGPETGYDVLANFQGPYSLHPVMARALGVPGAHLRLRTPPNSGGSFGVKMTLFPYIVLMCVAARVSGRPVKWIEDRVEHLAAANSAPNRVTEIKVAFDGDGRIHGLRLHHWDDNGGYLRAPMPAPMVRSNAFTTGPYAIENLDVEMEAVVTNKTPTGAVRGFGAPQVCFAMERAIQRVAVRLGKDPLDVIRINLVPKGAFPYRAAAGALYDSGDYQAVVEETVRRGGLAELRRRRDEARAQGRLYGIGYACAMEPGQSNMGYISTIKTLAERKRAGPKDGAIATATVSVDPSGSVSVLGDSVPQGQGHHTVISQIVADQLGLKPADITVNLELDTQKDGWSIAAGNYACRFGPSVASAVHLAAQKVRQKLAKIAAIPLNVRPEDLEFGGGRIFARTNPDNSIAFHRAAGVAHWSPASLPPEMAPGLRETATWSGAQLTSPTDQNQINSMLVYGFGFDFCGVEVDRDTGAIRIDKYVSCHDCGPLLHPSIAEGQVGGSFAFGVSTALFEEFVYGRDGSFLSGTFADYLVVTAPEMPKLTLIHPENPTPSPFTPLGTKSISEGNTTSTPVCIANAVADALDVPDIELPLSPTRMAALLFRDEPPRRSERQSSTIVPAAAKGGRSLAGSGEIVVALPPERIWDALLDAGTLRAIIPGCEHLEQLDDHRYRARVVLGIGPVRGTFEARVNLHGLSVAERATLSGSVTGPLGIASGEGLILLTRSGEGTNVHYSYQASVGGTIASVGGRMLDRTAKLVIGEFFERFIRFSAPAAIAGPPPSANWLHRIRSWIDRIKRMAGLS